VFAELGDDQTGERHQTNALSRLWRAERQDPGNIDQRLGDHYAAAEQVDPVAPQRGQLPEPQAAIDRHQHERPVPRVDHVSERGDLGGRQEALLSVLLSRQWHILSRVVRQPAVRDRGL
jgi:hypothetical protein